MINIDTRPDLITILIELTNHNCTFYKENQVAIELPQFQNKTEDPWYGLTLVCKPNRLSIDVYICKDETNMNADAYIATFENLTSLDDLITRVIDTLKTCSTCNKEVKLSDLRVVGNKIMCSECCKNIRSKTI